MSIDKDVRISELTEMVEECEEKIRLLRAVVDAVILDGEFYPRVWGPIKKAMEGGAL